MSNPCINRWGLNTFWHHFWYSDSRYALNLQQDQVFTDLIQTYLTYGTVTHSAFFHSTFWYKTSAKAATNDLKPYYRWAVTKGEEEHETMTARLRLASSETFQTRVSVLRFSSWFIVNLYWFQPDKDKNKRARRSQIETAAVITNSSKATLAPLTKLASLLPHLPNHLLRSKAAYTF